jgi:hypothetical protein
MTATGPGGDKRPFWRSRWWMPSFSLFLGLVVLAAFAVGGHTGDGLVSLAVMAPDATSAGR